MHECGTEKEKENPADKAARVTTRATVWMAIFTAILAIVGIGTYFVLKNQLREMHQAGIDSEATKRLDQRAWIGVEDITSIPPIPQEDKTWDIAATFRNSGKTPAINFLMQSSQHIQDSPPNVNAKCAEAIRKDESRTMLPPNGKNMATLHVVDHSPPNWEEQITAGGTLYVWGCVIYDDVFNGLHWMTYCGTFKPITKGGQIQFQACRVGNATGDGDPPK
jgi:hypothetical protein